MRENIRTFRARHRNKGCPECLEEIIPLTDPVHPLFAEILSGWALCDPGQRKRKRREDDPAVLLMLYIYGHMNRILVVTHAGA